MLHSVMYGCGRYVRGPGYLELAVCRWTTIDVTTTLWLFRGVITSDRSRPSDR